MADYEPDCNLTECNVASLPSEDSVLLEGSGADAEQTTGNSVVNTDNQNQIQCSSDMTECIANSLSAPLSISPRARDAATEQPTENLDTVSNSQNSAQSRSAFTECNAYSLLTQHAVSLDPCNTVDPEETVEKYVESDRQASGTPFFVGDDVNRKQLQSDSGSDSDRSLEGSEDSRYNTQLPAEERDRGYVSQQPGEVCDILPRKSDQRLKIEVSVSENQGHDKNISVKVNVPVHTRNTGVSVIVNNQQHGKETLHDLDNHMSDTNVLEQACDADDQTSNISSDSRGQDHERLTDFASSISTKKQESDSLGSALRGVYINGVSIELCDVAIEAPPGIQQLPPLMKKSTADIWSLSQEKVESFTHYFNGLGLGFETSRECAGIGQGYNEVNLKTGFFHRATHITVPTHRWLLDKGSLRLSDSLLKELTQLQVFASNSDEETQVQSRCNRIFQKYGSHIYVGDIHFGGIYSQVAQYSGAETDVSTTKQIVDASLAARDDAFSPGPVDVKYWTSFEGGEQSATSFENWESHLQKYPTLSTCIDRGKDDVGIWEILLNHTDGFKEARAISEQLQKTWERTQCVLPSDHQAGAESKEQINVGLLEVPEALPELIQHLQLGEYYPEKITIRDVMEVGEGMETMENEIANVPRTVLQKLIMLDCKGITSEIRKCVTKVNGSTEEDTSSSDSSTDLSELCPQDEQIHPADVFLAIFQCCDLNLKQILVEKMSQCCLAFPFLYMDQATEKLNLSLWALRNIKLAWRDAAQEAIEASAMKHPLKVVSCLRLGRPEISKSKLLNKIISNQNDEIFLNECSPNGDIPRRFADGLVEGSFFLPSGKKTQHFEDVTLFLNLRGDGLKHKHQVEILSQMSNTVLVFVDVSDLEIKDIQTEMIKIHQHCKNAIIVLSTQTKGMSKGKAEYLLKNFKAMIGKRLTKILAFTTEGKKNEDRLKNDLRQDIKKVLSHERGIELQEQLEMMQTFGVVVDEMNQHCQEGKAHADKLLSLLLGSKYENVKATFLPLQGENWSEWCKLKKKKSRLGQQTGIDDIGEIEEKMTGHRQKQHEMCNQLSPLMQAFIDGLEATIDSSSIHFYMQWLKMFFYDLSRSNLHPLLQEYEGMLHILKEAKDKSQGDIKRLQNDLMAFEQKMEVANLGIEHLIREMGQIYEAAIEVKCNCHSGHLWNLPILASRLLLKGHSIEILDGNASGMPLIWLKAVFHELEKHLKDERLFSLSVLGVQSSGKSTLLNTMFGLQCPVSVGRCTTGIYLQLVKVREGSNLPFRYLAIFDTEGLRAPERIETTSYDHDNELATFVIGLGNLTMINIKGENVSEAKDILQIVTHAFLRMMMVNEKMQRDRLCVFVHQNVPAFNAKEKLQKASQKFEKALDKMTAEAAALENIGDIQCFNQVIGFDNLNHIWYFPDLWHGDPPMASVNTGYHEKTMELKTDVLTLHAMKTQYLCNVIEMFDFLEDMWKGVLADDFVFGFQNSLVTKAYNQLEEKHSELKRNLETAYRDWKNEHQTQIKICEDHKSLLTTCDYLKCEVVMMICKKQEDMVNELSSFIDAHGQKEIMNSWKKQKRYALENAAEFLSSEAKKDIDQMQTIQEVSILKNNEQIHHKQQILIQAEKLAMKMKDKNIQDEIILEREFDNMWKEWIGSIANHTMGDSNVSIESNLIALLYEQYPGHANMVNHELACKPLSTPHEHDQLAGSLTTDDISKSDLSLTWKKSILAGMSQNERQRLKSLTTDIIDDIFRKIDSYLNMRLTESSGFHNNDAKEVLRLLDTGLKEFNADPHQPLKISKGLEVRLAVHTYAYANKMFADAQDYYDKNYSITAQLEEYKTSTWKMFHAQVHENVDMEAHASDLVCDQLSLLIREHVQERMGNAVVDKMVTHFGTKEKLIGEILQTLAKHNSYSEYRAYIGDTKAFVLEWLIECTNNHIFSRPSWYGAKASSFVTELIRSIKQSASEVSDESGNQKTIGAWITSLSQLLRESAVSIPLTTIQAPHVLDYHVQNFEKLNRLFGKYLNLTSKDLLKKFKVESKGTVRWLHKSPCEQIMDALWGCEAVCPFCKEPCKRSDKDHASSIDCHECVQHRPQGITSRHWRLGKKLVVENCNFLVQSEALFGCAGVQHSCNIKAEDQMETFHSYRESKTYLPKWHIQPSPDMSSTKYWKWFMCKHKTHIAQEAGVKVPSLPISWRLVTQKDALESVNVQLKHEKISLYQTIRHKFLQNGKA